MNEYLDLFLTFSKIGAFMFGGGYAMLPLLSKELIEKRKWTTEEEIMDYFAISQCTPGIIAVNTATFIGNKRKGTLGGIIATLGVIFVPTIVLLLFATVLKHFWDNPYVEHAFAGIRIVVAALIINAAFKLAKSNVKRPLDIILCIVSFAVIYFLNLSTVYVIILSALLGLLLYWRSNKK